jgi:hypothetical protein
VVDPAIVRGDIVIVEEETFLYYLESASTSANQMELTSFETGDRS